MAKKATYSFYLPKKLVINLQQAADAEDVPASLIVESAIESALEELGYKLPEKTETEATDE